MKIPSKAMTNVRDGLQKLGDLAPGEVLHYYIVRLAGPKDKDVRVVFADAAADASREAFQREWSGDEAVKSSQPTDWHVARGAFTATDKGVVTLPAVRGNRVTASADVKAQLKGLRESLTDAHVNAAGLKRAVDGKFGRATDTSKLGGEGSGADVADDESDLVGKASTNRTTKGLVDRFRQLGLKTALEELAAASSEERKQKAIAVGGIRDLLLQLLDDARAADAELRGELLGSTRHKKNLSVIEDVATRAKAALHSIEVALGLAFEGTDLAPDGVATIHDPILDTLRQGIAKVNAVKEEDAKVKALADVFFAADYWLKAAGSGSGARAYSNTLDLSMKPKVEEVYGKVARDLARRAKVTINNLPAWLEQHYGKGMEHHGTMLDVEHGYARWMNENQRDVFRVHIHGGTLLQYDWWNWNLQEVWESKGRIDLSEFKLTPVDSANAESPDVITPGYAGFVMSMGGDLYITRQAPEEEDGASLYHSSYMAGLPVLMAGEILIRDGHIARANTGSGHYRPAKAMIVRFLKTLEMQGVTVGMVADHANENGEDAEEFLKRNRDEVPDAEAFRENDIKMAKYRQAIFFSRLFPQERKNIAYAMSIAEGLAARYTALVKAWTSLQGVTGTKRGPLEEAFKLAEVQLSFTREGVGEARGLATEAKMSLRSALNERNVNHEELKRKDATPTDETADGYAEVIEGLIDQADTALAWMAFESKRSAVAPAKATTTAPWDIPNHGTLSRTDAEKLLGAPGQWLFRFSGNEKMWVVSLRKSPVEVNHQLIASGGRDRLLKTYPIQKVVSP